MDVSTKFIIMHLAALLIISRSARTIDSVHDNYCQIRVS